ncbi:dynein heavy chain 5, axonemal [Caerostris extrusa]|uniref:Dynein heavy chain 5, axonemal n=1 Tax=Caerostris extrusa TaxID=172846 RepID=A0AAV4PE52_CAEEX|nr:dynein heavy chain 5, axonemal [Caerostris extrusa]
MMLEICVADVCMKKLLVVAISNQVLERNTGKPEKQRFSDIDTAWSHLLGVFENVFNVRFDPDEYNKITAVISKEGDEIPKKLDRPVMAEGNVELWLGDLLVVQQMSLNTVIKAAFNSLLEEEFELITFIDKYIAQVALLGIQILWTRDGEEALSFAKVSKKIMTFTNKKFGEILRKLIAQTTLDLSSFVRVKMKIKTPTDFEWLKQARFYYFLDEGTNLKWFDEGQKIDTKWSGISSIPISDKGNMSLAFR